MLPDLRLPLGATEEELRQYLIDGTIFCTILNKLRPTSAEMVRSYFVLCFLQFNSLFSFRVNFTCLHLFLDVVLHYLSMFLLQFQDGGSKCGPEKVKRFLQAMDEMGLPSFELSEYSRYQLNWR